MLSPRRSSRRVGDSALSESSHFKKGMLPVLLSIASDIATSTAPAGQGAAEELYSPCCGGPPANLGGTILGPPSPLRRLPPRLEIPSGVHDKPQVTFLSFLFSGKSTFFQHAFMARARAVKQIEVCGGRGDMEKREM